MVWEPRLGFQPVAWAGPARTPTSCQDQSSYCQQSPSAGAGLGGAGACVSCPERAASCASRRGRCWRRPKLAAEPGLQILTHPGAGKCTGLKVSPAWRCRQPGVCLPQPSFRAVQREGEKGPEPCLSPALLSQAPPPHSSRLRLSILKKCFTLPRRHFFTPFSERKRVRNIDWLPSRTQADQESNPRPSGLRDDTPNQPSHARQG